MHTFTGDLMRLNNDRLSRNGKLVAIFKVMLSIDWPARTIAPAPSPLAKL